MVNMFQAMNIRDQDEATRREAARQVNAVAANAGVHRRLNTRRRRSTSSSFHRDAANGMAI